VEVTPQVNVFSDRCYVQNIHLLRSIAPLFVASRQYIRIEAEQVWICLFSLCCLLIVRVQNVRFSAPRRLDESENEDRNIVICYVRTGSLCFIFDAEYASLIRRMVKARCRCISAPLRHICTDEVRCRCISAPSRRVCADELRCRCILHLCDDSPAVRIIKSGYATLIRLPSSLFLL
jgi:hypothetical protein